MTHQIKSSPMPARRNARASRQESMRCMTLRTSSIVCCAAPCTPCPNPRPPASSDAATPATADGTCPNPNPACSDAAARATADGTRPRAEHQPAPRRLPAPAGLRHLKTLYELAGRAPYRRCPCGGCMQ